MSTVPPNSNAVQSFIEHLSQLREAAGNPSYAHLAALSDQAGPTKGKLPSSTLHNVLRGNRRELPRPEFVDAYVKACQRAAEEAGKDLRLLGTLGQWQDLYQAASRGKVTKTCPVCPPRRPNWVRYPGAHPIRTSPSLRLL